MSLIDATAKRVPEAHRRSFLEEAQRVAKLAADVDAAWLTCTACGHEHRGSPKGCRAELPREDGDKIVRRCGCSTFESAIGDEERAQIIRTMRGEQVLELETPAEQRLVESLIPERFRTVMLEGYRSHTPSQDLARRAVRRFVERVKRGEHTMLALIGETGTGKSHLAYAALRELITWGAGRFPLYARPWYKLADELRWGGHSPYTGARIEQHDVRRLLNDGRIAVIDEVRYTAGTEFDSTELAKYACHAYDANVSVILTTNASPLELVTGPAAASRFTQLVIEGPDARQGGRDRAAGDR